MAHGLLLRMQEMLEFNSGEINHGLRINVNVIDAPIIRAIQSWISAVKNPRNSKMEFFTLLRQTLLLILAPEWMQSSKQRDLLYAFSHHNRRFPSLVRNYNDICNTIQHISKNPWHNTYFKWEDLYDEKLTYEDKCIQDYFHSEPEEVVLARVNYLARDSESFNKALVLAKQLFLYHYRTTKFAVFYSKPAFRERNRFIKERSRRGHASIDWIVLILLKKKSLPQIVKELQEFSCHEGIEIIGRMRENPQYKKFSYDVINIFLVRDLTNPSQYCCTKKLFVLFCIMHKELNSGPKEIAGSAIKILARLAPSSAHFYLFVDVAYEEFGTRCIDLYVDLYVRGLTADLNHLDIKKQADATDAVNNLETHIATIFAKLSTLFNNFHEAAARECMFSAFSLRPTKERLLELQRLTQSLKSTDKGHLNLSSSSNSLVPLKDGSDRSSNAISNDSLEIAHPLLNKGIRNISYNVIKDFVSLLESARNIIFQYNVFDWRRTVSELGDYLVNSNVKRPAIKDWSSDTEVGSDGSSKSDSEESESKFECSASNLVMKKIVAPVKRKSDSDVSKEICTFDVGANIEVASNDTMHKKIKLEKPDLIKVPPPAISELSKSSEDLLHSAIEEVIRKTLNNNISKGQSVIYSVPTKHSQLMGSSQSSISPGISKMSSENLVPPAHIKQINSVQEHCHPFTSKSILPNHKPNIEMSYSSHVPSVPAVNHNVRQSVVVAPVSNALVKRTNICQRELSKELYPVQKSMAKSHNVPVKKVWKDSNFSTEGSKSEGSKINQGALNLSPSKSNSGKQHFQTYPSKASVFLKEPVTMPSSSSVYDSVYYSHPKKQPHIPLEQKMQISCDRNSVIQHTMQHASQKTHALSNQLAVSVDSSTLQRVKERSSPILNQLSVSADSSVMQHVRNNLQKDRPVISQFNVSNAKISKPNLPASSVFSPKPSFTGMPTQSNQSSLDQYKSAVLPKTQTTLSSTTMPSWKKNLSQTATKVATISNTSSAQKPYPKPYERPLDISSQLQAQYLKHGCTIEPSKGTIPLIKPTPLVNENFTPSSQPWTSVSDASTLISNQQLNASSSTNNSQWLPSSSQYNSAFSTNNSFSHSLQPSSSSPIPNTSSQPWYSSPYPKPITSSHATVPSFTSGVKPRETPLVMQKFSQSAIDKGVKNTTIKASTYSSKDKLIQQTPPEMYLFKPSVNSLASNAKTNLNVAIVSPLENKTNEHNRQLTDIPTILSTVSLSSVASSVSNSRLICDRLAISSPHHYSSNSYDDSVLVRDDKGVVVFRAANVVPASQYNAESGGNFVKACCSPLEVQPCQNCSSASESNAFQAVNLSNPVSNNHLHNHKEKVHGSRISVVSNSNEDSLVPCEFCSFEYPISLMLDHMEMSHKNELKDRQCNYMKNSTIEKTPVSVHSSTSLQKSSTSPKHDPGGENACAAEDDESLLNMCFDFISNQQNLSKLENNASSLVGIENSTSLIQYTKTSFSIPEVTRNTTNSLLSNFCDLSKDEVMTNTTTESGYPNLASYAKSTAKLTLANSEQNSENFAAHSSSNKLPYDSMSNSAAMKELKGLNFVNDRNIKFPESSGKNLNQVDMNLYSNNADINPRADMSSSESNTFNCGICKEKLPSHSALQKHIAECYLKFADEAFESLSPSREIKPVYNKSERDAYNDALFNSISKTSEDLRKNDVSHQSGIFDFDPHGNDNAIKETYRPVQKVKSKPSASLANVMPSEQKIAENSNAVPSCKKIKEKQLKPCQFCGKMLTVLYMKQHYLNKHKEKYLAMNSQQTAVTSAHQNKLPSVSSLLEGLDSNACLSPSDAQNFKVNVTDDFGISPSCDGSSTEPCKLKENEIKSKLKSKIFNKSDSFDRNLENSDLTLKDGKKSYKCHICHTIFSTEYFLISHLKAFHDFHGPLPTNKSDLQKDDKLVSSLHSIINDEAGFLNEKSLKTTVNLNEQTPCKLSSSTENTQPRSSKANFKNCIIYGVSDLMSSSSNLDLVTDSALTISSCEKPQIKGSLTSENNKNKTNGIAKKCIEKIHKCHLCPKAFSYGRNLTKHLGIHHDIQSSASGQCLGNELDSKCSSNEINNINSSVKIKIKTINDMSESHLKATQPDIRSVTSSGCESVSKDKLTTSVANQISPINLGHQDMTVFVDQESQRSALTSLIESENGPTSNEKNDSVCRFCWLKFLNEVDLNRHYVEKHSFNSTVENMLKNFEPSRKIEQIFHANGDENKTSQNSISSELSNNFNGNEKVPPTSSSIFENCTVETNFATIKNETVGFEPSSEQNSEIRKFRLNQQYTATTDVGDHNSARFDKITKKVSISKGDHICDICLKKLSTLGNLTRHKKVVHSMMCSDKSAIQKSEAKDSYKSDPFVPNADIFSDEHFKMPGYVTPLVDQISNNEGKSTDNFDQMLSELFSATEERDESLRTFSNSLTFDLENDLHDSVIPKTDTSYEANMCKMNSNQIQEVPNINSEVPNHLSTKSLLTSKFELSLIHNDSVNKEKIEQKLSLNIDSYCGELEGNKEFSKKSPSNATSGILKGIGQIDYEMIGGSATDSLDKNMKSSNTSNPVTQPKDDQIELEVAEQVEFFCKPNHECGVCSKLCCNKSTLQDHIKRVHMNINGQNKSVEKAKLKNSACSLKEFKVPDSFGTNFCPESKKKVACPVCQKEMVKNSIFRHMKKFHANIDKSKYKMKTILSDACQTSVFNKNDFKKFDGLVSDHEQGYPPVTNQCISMHSGSVSNGQSWPMFPQENDQNQQNSHSMNLTVGPVDSLIGSNASEDVLSRNLQSDQGSQKSLPQILPTVSVESFSPLQNLEVLDTEEKSMPHLVPECEFSIENELREIENNNSLTQSLLNAGMIPVFETNNGINAKQQENQVVHILPNSLDVSQSASNFDLQDVEYDPATIEKMSRDSPLLSSLLMGSPIQDETKNFFEESIVGPSDKTLTSANTTSPSKIILEENTSLLGLLNSDASMQENHVKLSSNLFYDEKPLANAQFRSSSGQASPNDRPAPESLNEKNTNECFDTSNLSTNFSQSAATELSPKPIKDLDYTSVLTDQPLTPTMPLVMDGSDGFLNNIGEQKHVYSYNHNFVLSVLQDLGVSHDTDMICNQSSVSESVMKSTESCVNEKIVSPSAVCDTSIEMHLNDGESKTPGFSESPDETCLNLVSDSSLKQSLISDRHLEVLEIQQLLANCIDTVCSNEDSFDLESNSTVSIVTKSQGNICHSLLSAKSKNTATNRKKGENRKWSPLKTKCNQTVSDTGKDKSVIKKSLKTSFLNRSKSKSCYQCHKRFKSMYLLSKHLKIVHSVPVLKKQNSSTIVNSCPEIIKLSPPNLSLLSTYDSESSNSASIVPSAICENILMNSRVKEVVDDITQSDQSSACDIGPSNKSSMENPPVTETSPSGSSPKMSLKLKTVCEPSSVKKRLLCRVTEKQSRNASLGVKESKNASTMQDSQSNLSGKSPKHRAEDEPSHQRNRSNSTSRNSKHQIPISSIEPVCNSVSDKSSIDKGRTVAPPENVDIIENSVKVDQNSIQQKTALPKCIIKVCKDNRNSVFYQIDNSQKKSDVQLSMSINDSNIPKLRKRSIEELSDDCIIISSSDSENSDDTEWSSMQIRRRRSCSSVSKFRKSGYRALNFKSRLPKSSLSEKTTVKSKHTRLSAEKYTKAVSQTFKGSIKIEQFSKELKKPLVKLEKSFLGEKTTVKSKQTTNLSAEKCTKEVCQIFKESINIEQFLKEHSQPLVKLRRIEDMKKDGNNNVDGKGNSEHHKTQKITPVVVLERINIQAVAGSPLPQNSSDICSINEICFQTKNVSKSLIKSSDITSEKVTLREKSNVSLDIHTFPNDVAFKGEGSKKADSQDPTYCAPGDEENCLLVTSIKECCVVLKKLPL